MKAPSTLIALVAALPTAPLTTWGSGTHAGALIEEFGAVTRWTAGFSQR
jgi:hypothetical protein